jgi:hypothetical protein
MSWPALRRFVALAVLKTSVPVPSGRGLISLALEARRA